MRSSAITSMRSVEEHQRVVAGLITARPAITAELPDAEGLVLVDDVTATVSLPVFDNSAMDGYAVRFSDLEADGETVLRRIGESFAGKPWPGSAIGAGECVRIFTGGVMPQGADTVVMQERASEDAKGVHIACG